jgi:hypothetical protein
LVVKKRYIIVGIAGVLAVSALFVRPQAASNAPSASSESASATVPENAPVPQSVLDNIVGPALKDPSAAVWGPAVYIHHGSLPVICGSVRSRNSFGALTGQVRFISLGNVQATAFEDASRHFRQEWRMWCSAAAL